MSTQTRGFYSEGTSFWLGSLFVLPLWIWNWPSVLQVSEWLISNDVKSNEMKMMFLHWHECHWFCRHSFSSPVRNSSLFLFGGSPSPLTSRLQCEPMQFGESFLFLAETLWQYFTINPIPNATTAVSLFSLELVVCEANTSISLWLVHLKCSQWSHHVDCNGPCGRLGPKFLKFWDFSFLYYFDTVLTLLAWIWSCSQRF